jgi:hypothetical protein
MSPGQSRTDFVLRNVNAAGYSSVVAVPASKRFDVAVSPRTINIPLSGDDRKAQAEGIC